MVVEQASHESRMRNSTEAQVAGSRKQMTAFPGWQKVQTSPGSPVTRPTLYAAWSQRWGLQSSRWFWTYHSPNILSAAAHRSRIGMCSPYTPRPRSSSTHRKTLI